MTAKAIMFTNNAKVTCFDARLRSCTVGQIKRQLTNIKFTDFHVMLLHTYLITYLLTPWSTVLPEKLTGVQLVKKFPAFYGTRRLITAFTITRHLSLSLASSIQSIPLYAMLLCTIRGIK
jgi:hypothetical protein